MAHRIERRIVRTRSRWHRFWMFCLLAYSLVMAWNLWSLASRIGDLRAKAKGLEHLAISAVGQSRLTEAAYMWAGGAAIFVILAWITRGTTVIEERHINDDEAGGRSNIADDRPIRQLPR